MDIDIARIALGLKLVDTLIKACDDDELDALIKGATREMERRKVTVATSSPLFSSGQQPQPQPPHLQYNIIQQPQPQPPQRQRHNVGAVWPSQSSVFPAAATGARPKHPPQPIMATSPSLSAIATAPISVWPNPPKSVAAAAASNHSSSVVETAVETAVPSVPSVPSVPPKATTKNEPTAQQSNSLRVSGIDPNISYETTRTMLKKLIGQGKSTNIYVKPRSNEAFIYFANNKDTLRGKKKLEERYYTVEIFSQSHEEVTANIAAAASGKK